MGQILVHPHDGWDVPRSAVEGEKQHTEESVLTKSHFCKAEREHLGCVGVGMCVHLCV